MTRLIILATLALVLASAPASARCFKFQNGCTADTGPSRHYITNTSRQIVGDVYDPGTGGRLQIRDTHRRIVGYIERSGRITNRHRQHVGSIESFGLGVY